MKQAIDFLRERDRDLLLVYARLSGIYKEMPSFKVIELAVNSPAKRFYVNPEEVKRTLRERRLGLDTGSRRRSTPLKAAMYDELERRVAINRKRNGNIETKAIYDAVFSPAPQFYISTKHALDCISRSLRRNQYGRCTEKEI